MRLASPLGSETDQNHVPLTEHYVERAATYRKGLKPLK